MSLSVQASNLSAQAAEMEQELSVTTQLLVEAIRMQDYWTQRAEKAEAVLREIAECHECSGSQCREIAAKIATTSTTAKTK